MGKVLITGAEGMLGSDLVTHFAEKLSRADLVAADHRSLDITDAAAVAAAIDHYRPSVVINAAAYTNVDKAESERPLARAINALGPTYLARACAPAGIFLVHFSTDQVFDGAAVRPYREQDPVHPLNYYAQSKLAGEEAVLAYENSLVLRVQWLYGARKDRFTPLREKTVFTPFADQYGAPTWTQRIATLVDRLAERRVTGLYHLAYDDHASWAQVFEFVKAELKLTVELRPQLTCDLKLPAQRPLYSVLSNQKLRDCLGENLGSWKSDLAQFLHRLP